jgi:aspartyl-tRNA(Asn)/glutamyl-tRNA(Gln) amidotransferase subunit B
VDLAALIDMVSSKKINNNTGKAVLGEMFQTGRAPAEIVREKGLDQVSDQKYLEEVVRKILDENPKEVSEYLAGKETLFGWFMGQAARLTQGKADPQVTRELLTRGLSDRRK